MLNYLFVAGVNGSGKSTFIKQIKNSKEYSNYKYICADELEKDIPKNITNVERLKKAKEIANNLKNILIANKDDFIFESVCSHHSHLDDLKRIKQQGYSITLLYVTTENPEINLERISNRHRDNDYYLTPDRVKRRYQRSLDLLADLIEIVDTAYVYDNSSDDFINVFYKENSEYFLTYKKSWVNDYIITKLKSKGYQITETSNH